MPNDKKIYVIFLSKSYENMSKPVYLNLTINGKEYDCVENCQSTNHIDVCYELPIAGSNTLDPRNEDAINLTTHISRSLLVDGSKDLMPASRFSTNFKAFEENTKRYKLFPNMCWNEYETPPPPPAFKYDVDEVPFTKTKSFDENLHAYQSYEHFKKFKAFNDFLAAHHDKLIADNLNKVSVENEVSAAIKNAIKSRKLNYSNLEKNIELVNVQKTNEWRGNDPVDVLVNYIENGENVAVKPKLNKKKKTKVGTKQQIQSIQSEQEKDKTKQVDQTKTTLEDDNKAIKQPVQNAVVPVEKNKSKRSEQIKSPADAAMLKEGSKSKRHKQIKVPSAETVCEKEDPKLKRQEQEKAAQNNSVCGKQDDKSKSESEQVKAAPLVANIVNGKKVGIKQQKLIKEEKKIPAANTSQQQLMHSETGDSNKSVATKSKKKQKKSQQKSKLAVQSTQETKSSKEIAVTPLKAQSANNNSMEPVKHNNPAAPFASSIVAVKSVNEKLQQNNKFSTISASIDIKPNTKNQETMTEKIKIHETTITAVGKSYSGINQTPIKAPSPKPITILKTNENNKDILQGSVIPNIQTKAAAITVLDETKWPTLNNTGKKNINLTEKSEIKTEQEAHRSTQSDNKNVSDKVNKKQNKRIYTRSFNSLEPIRSMSFTPKALLPILKSTEKMYNVTNMDVEYPALGKRPKTLNFIKNVCCQETASQGNVITNNKDANGNKHKIVDCIENVALNLNTEQNTLFIDNNLTVLENSTDDHEISVGNEIPETLSSFDDNQHESFYPTIIDGQSAAVKIDPMENEPTQIRFGDFGECEIDVLLGGDEVQNVKTVDKQNNICVNGFMASIKGIDHTKLATCEKIESEILAAAAIETLTQRHQKKDISKVLSNDVSNDSCSECAALFDHGLNGDYDQFGVPQTPFEKTNAAIVDYISSSWNKIIDSGDYVLITDIEKMD